MGFAQRHFRTFARYNVWANARIYAACAKLSAEEYLKSRPSFFASIHLTLNHILVGDRLWMGRFTGNRPIGIKSLDQEIYSDLSGLTVARQAEDAKISAYIESLDEADYDNIVFYTTMAGRQHHDPLSRLLAHFFNHQTHHRGQVHDQLTQTALFARPAEPPELDLIYFMREAGADLPH